MTGILIFLLVLSVLVGVHELGHFLAAKACGIYVDRFSIGMPPRLFGFKWGETDYCIGALPIGGYVKMAGQEDAPQSDEQRDMDYGNVPPDRWFSNKPVWQRIIVLVAGPLMNVVLAVLLFGIIAAVGTRVPEFEHSGRLGQIVEDSPAAKAALHAVGPDGQADFSSPPDAVGLEPGDYVLSINGSPVESIRNLALAAILSSQDMVHTLVVEREALDGERTRYITQMQPAPPAEADGHPQFGVAPFITSLVDTVMEGSPAEEAGLQEEDIILAADGSVVDQSTFVRLVERVPEGEEIRLSVLRDGEVLEVPLRPRTVGRIQGAAIGGERLRDPDPASTQPVVLSINDEMRAETGLQRRDRILSVNGVPATLESLREHEQASPGGVLQLEVDRPAIMLGLMQRAETLSVEVPVAQVRAIGIVHKVRMVDYRVPPAQIVPEAVHRSYEAVRLTVLSLKALATQDLSPRELGGPVMIGRLVTQEAEAGWAYLFRIAAFISVNLAIINLLPLPVLDGGQIVVQVIEAIRRKPLSPAFLERFQMLGLFLIIGLMLFVTWNDIGRWISDLRP